jgi:hypothetical protein
MADKRRRAQLAEVPAREQLEALARHYHHLQNEHKRSPPESSIRRRIEDKLLDVRQRFDRLLDEFVRDDDLRTEWLNYLRYQGPVPDGPPAVRPVVFRGVSADSGSEAEIRRRDSEIEISVDGSLVERRDVKLAPTETAGPARMRLSTTEYVEVVHASDEALDALAEFRDSPDTPPWEYAAELLEDGLVDSHFAVTPRGHRVLGMRS